ncbi:MAG: thioredoxin domain-containing protein [Nitriliruptoraceae bacterium]
MNELKHATSPYLLQHAQNPVHWRQWGDSAFAEARERDVPIFLSVGYSSCHWCHVMAHESFEDAAIAGVLNENFVNIKVDREERPDVDAVYMQAVTALTGHGGWPMSAFLTPDGKPFFAGTYWPPEPRHGMPGFRQVIDAVAEAWRERRDQAMASADKIATTLAAHASGQSESDLDLGVADDAARLIVEQAWDRQHGGFGRAPKFPQAMTIEWLLHHHARTGDTTARDAAVQALHAMAAGGIHDQLAGGFARYSTDATWLVPHFEKMLYDNALLLAAYAAGASATGDQALADVAASIVHYLDTELATADGVLIAATDADSEGVEGRYFVWDDAEFREVVAAAGADPDTFAAWFGVAPGGNWEGTNILHTPRCLNEFVADQGLDPDEFAGELPQVRAALLAQRAGRVPPGADDKILTDWNALAVRSLVIAGRLLDEPAWIARAVEVADTVHSLVQVDGRLHHSFKDGHVGAPGFLEDHAYLALADLELFSATGDERWFARGLALAEAVHERFHDEATGDWYQTAVDAEPLFTRPKQTWDNATPSGSSVMAEVCLLLADLTGEHRWRERAEAAIAVHQEAARTMPTGYGWLLRNIEALAAGRRQVAIVGQQGPDRHALERMVYADLRPGTTTVVAPADHTEAVPLLAGRFERDGRSAAYVCHDLVCASPVTAPGELQDLLDA